MAGLCTPSLAAMHACTCYPARCRLPPVRPLGLAKPRRPLAHPPTCPPPFLPPCLALAQRKRSTVLVNREPRFLYDRADVVAHVHRALAASGFRGARVDEVGRGRGHGAARQRCYHAPVPILFCICMVLPALNTTHNTHPPLQLYVDEVQDLTQAEQLLALHLVAGGCQGWATVVLSGSARNTALATQCS